MHSDQHLKNTRKTLIGRRLIYHGEKFPRLKGEVSLVGVSHGKYLKRFLKTDYALFKKGYKCLEDIDKEQQVLVEPIYTRTCQRIAVKFRDIRERI